MNVFPECSGNEIEVLSYSCLAGGARCERAN
jgi:hypothetical protein